MTYKLFFILFMFLLSSVSYASVDMSDNAKVKRYQNPFYIGLTYGYGTTTWDYLVPEEYNPALALSTPTQSSEGGAVWGGFIGYEFFDAFAGELSYQRFPDATISFDEYSLINYQYDGLNEFTSKAEIVSLVGKCMAFIPYTFYRLFASAGVAEVHRADQVYNHWHLSPSFGGGININMNERFMAELGADYIAGDALSELDPAEHFVPFLWSIHFRLAYRFTL